MCLADLIDLECAEGKSCCANLALPLRCGIATRGCAMSLHSGLHRAERNGLVSINPITAIALARIVPPTCVSFVANSDVSPKGQNWK
jgi:hypothetical protein